MLFGPGGFCFDVVYVSGDRETKFRRKGIE